jgi:hypothetical protein
MASYSDILLLSYLAQGESAVHGFANWGEAAVSNFNFLEDAIGETVSITLASSNVTLTAAQERALYLDLGGTLGANVEVRTNDRKGFWFVSNDTSGAFSVTFKTTSGSGVVVPQGGKAILVSDGTDILSMSSFASLGLGTIASQDADSVAITGGSVAGITDLAVADGGTGASDASTARTNLGVAIGSDVQAYSTALASIAGLTTSANQMIYLTGASTYATASITSAGLALLDDADASAQRTTLGLGTAATTATSDYATAAQGTKADTALQSADLTGYLQSSDIGSTVQGYDAGLASIAGLTTAADRMIYTTGSDTYAVATLTTAGRALLDDADAAAQRTTLGLGSAATTAASAYATAAQGALADSALQSADIGSSIQAYDADLAAIAALSPSDGDVLTYDTGAWTAAAPSGGTPGLVPIGSLVTISGTPAAVDISLSGGYQEYVLKFWKLKPATDGTLLYLRTSTDGGSTFDATAGDYAYTHRAISAGSATSYGKAVTSAAQIAVVESPVSADAVGNGTNEDGANGEIIIYAPADANHTGVSYHVKYKQTAGNIASVYGGSGVRLAAADVDAIRLLFSSGNITSGKYQLYGVSTG